MITPAVGGAFGAKFGADAEHALVARLAQRLGRPVTWVETRSENMVAMTHGRAQVQTITIGGSRDGRVEAYRLHVLQDSGAYPKFGGLLPTLTLLMAPGVYDIEHGSSPRSPASSPTPRRSVRTAAPGRPEATAAIERAMDLFAAEIGMDPAEVRRRNLLPAFTEPVKSKGGATYDSGDYPAALDAVLAAADYDGLRARAARPAATAATPCKLGIGLSVYVEITGGGDESGPPNENATVEVHPDGSRDHPDRHLSARPGPLRRCGRCWPARRLGIPIEKITVKWGDTDLVPEGRRDGRIPQPATGRRRGAAGGPGAGRAGQAAGRRPARGQRRRPRGRPRPGRRGRARRTGQRRQLRRARRRAAS